MLHLALGGIISTDDFPGKAFSIDDREWLFRSTRESPFQSTFGSDFFDRRFLSARIARALLDLTRLVVLVVESFSI